MTSSEITTAIFRADGRGECQPSRDDEGQLLDRWNANSTDSVPRIGPEDRNC